VAADACACVFADDRRMSVAIRHPPGPTGVRRGRVRGAAEWRKRLRRELLRVGAANVSVYVDGRRGIAYLRFPKHADRLAPGAHDALALLRSLPDRAGVEATFSALAGP
jgi:hypothetical protein